MATLAAWYWSLGSISVATVNTPKVEVFYWIAITFSQTLGTALGDWTADDTGLGYDGGALLFAAGLAVLAALYFWTSMSRVFLFWAAFILTRPLGATVGDFLDKPRSDGGMALSRPIASAVIAAFIIVCLLVLPQRAGQHPGQADARVMTPAGASGSRGCATRTPRQWRSPRRRPAQEATRNFRSRQSPECRAP